MNAALKRRTEPPKAFNSVFRNVDHSKRDAGLAKSPSANHSW
jgi:hypothetical protein